MSDIIGLHVRPWEPSGPDGIFIDYPKGEGQTWVFYDTIGGGHRH